MTKTPLMQLDGIEHRYHVRELDNRVAVVLSKPGWACKETYPCDYWYLSIEDLTNNMWEFRPGSAISGLSHVEAVRLAHSTYERLATERRG